MNNDKSIQEKNLRIEKRVLNFSLYSCLGIAILELIVGFILHANSVITVAIVDAMDSLLTVPFIFLVPKLYKPATEKAPYGYAQLESLFLVIEYSIQICVLISMIRENVGLLLHGGNRVDALGVAILQIVITIACAFIYGFINYNSKKFESPVIHLELVLWKIAILSCGGVACAFIFQFFITGTSIDFVAPYVDPAVAVIIALILLKTPVTSLFKSVRDLLLFAPPEDTMHSIKSIVTTTLEGTNYSLAFLDVVETGRTLWIEVYMKSKNGIFITEELFTLREKLKEQLNEEYESVHIEMAAELGE